MNVQAKHFYDFGPFRLDVAERLLLRDGESFTLPPKAFETLLALVENSGHLLNKEDLMKRLWPDTFVEEANLANNISLLRKVLGDDAQVRQYIETVPKLGYRFVAGVKESFEEGAELTVRERTRAQFTIEEEAEETDEQARSLAAPRWARRFRLPALIACALLAAAAGYYVWPGRAVPPPPAAPPSVRSIAVLPFKPLVEASRDEILEMGMADTLITRLSNIRQINVRSTSAVRRYAGLGHDPVAAGREQRVDAVLDGNIQKSGDKIRVTVRLVRVGDGATLWTEQFDEKFTDIFAVQDAISQRVAEVLIVKLTGEEREALAKRYTENPEAYQLYLRGRYFWSKRTEEGFKKGVEYFQQAIEKDPRHALAYADLAASYKMFPYYGLLPPMEAHPRAKEAVTKALEIDEALAEAHAAMASILESADWDWPAAEEEFKRAIELKPNYATAHHWYGLFLERMGRLTEAEVEMTRALELDPVSLIINKNAADPYYFMRQYDKAIARYQKTLELDPSFSMARLWLGQSYEQKGMYEKAIAEFRKARLSDDNSAILAALGHAYAVSGNRSEAEKIINELKRLSKRYVAPYHIATVYVGLRNKDEAFQWLESAYQGRDEWLLYLNIDPRLDGLRSDPRFLDLLRRMNFTP